MNNTKTLVLNLDYSPISVCTMQRAFVLVMMQKADLVEKNPSYDLHTVDTTFPMPSVIRLKQYINIRFQNVILSRENVFKRDNHKCQYCGSDKNLTLDHVTPRAKGGKTTWNNLITACQTCNSKKGDYTPEEAGLTLTYKPYKPSFILFLKSHVGRTKEEWMPYLGLDNSAHWTNAAG